MANDPEGSYSLPGLFWGSCAHLSGPPAGSSELNSSRRTYTGKIDRRRGGARMTEKLLDGHEVGTVLNEIDGVSVPQPVKMDSLADACPSGEPR